MISKILNKLLSMPDFSDERDRIHFSYVVAGTFLNVAGSWFVQIAVFSTILLVSGRKAPIAIYFLCSSFPRIMASYVWSFLVRRYQIRSIVIWSQLVGCIFCFFQIYAVIINNLMPLYVATAIQSLVGSLILIAYDSITVSNFKNSKDINKANSILLIIRYSGLTILPLIGAYCASAFGNVSAFIVNTLLYIPGIVLFQLVPSHFYPLNDSAHGAPVSFKLNGLRRFLNYTIATKNRLIVIYLCNTAYGILNYLLPILIFVRLGADKTQYGLVTTLSGIAYIISGKIINTNLLSALSDKLVNRFAIISTLLNGATLFVMSVSYDLKVLTVYLLLACVFSVGSMVYLKTSLFSSVSEDDRCRLPNIYNGIQWAGCASGYMLCGLFGDRLSEVTLAVIMTVLLLGSPLLMLQRFATNYSDRLQEGRL